MPVLNFTVSLTVPDQTNTDNLHSFLTSKITDAIYLHHWEYAIIAQVKALSEAMFTNYEIHPVKEYEQNGEKFCEQCEYGEEDFFSLYGRTEGQGLDCIGDFTTEARAIEFYERITGLPYSG